MTDPLSTANPQAARAPAWAWLLVSALTLSSGLLGLLGAPYLDPIRDVYFAHQIASGQSWPLIGPEIGFFTHLGPVWFYLLAPALLVNSSLLAVAAWVGLLKGLMFPLALLLGCRLGHWRLGLILAMLLTGPGLISFLHLSFNHFALVPACLIALLILVRSDWQAATVGKAFAIGLMFALLLHAHPATLAFAWLPAWLWLRAPQRLARALALVAGFSLPLLPLLAAALLTGLPATPTGGALAHLQDHFSLRAAIDTPILIWHSLVGGYLEGLRLSTQAGLPGHWILPVLSGTLLLLAIPGLWQLRDHEGLRWIAAIAVISLPVQAVFALLIRGEILWYMVLALPTMALLAWSALLAALAHRWMRQLALGLAIAVGLGSQALLLSSMLESRNDIGQRHFSPAFMLDLMSGPAAASPYPGPQLSFFGSDQLARWLCEQPGPLVLHAALAQQADGLTDLMGRLHCPDQLPLIRIGGHSGDDIERWLAVGPALAEAFPHAGFRTLESLHFFPVDRVLHPARGPALARAADYPPRPRSLPADETSELQFESPAGAMLLISNPYPWYATLELVELRHQHGQAAPLAADIVTRAYRCGACTETELVQWTLRWRGPAALPPDIVLVQP